MSADCPNVLHCVSAKPSEIAHDRIRTVTDVLNEGDDVEVKVLDVDRAGKIKLSRKALLQK